MVLSLVLPVPNQQCTDTQLAGSGPTGAMAPSGGQFPPVAATSYLVHHIALPQKLPQASGRL